MEKKINHLIFNCTMSLDEARFRQEVAKLIEGVTFEIEKDPLEDSSQRVIGRTVAENKGALKAQAIEVRKYIYVDD